MTQDTHSSTREDEQEGPQLSPVLANEDVVVVTTCKGRLSHLQQSLPALLDGTDAGMDFATVVVDYGCPDGTFEWCRAQHHRRLHTIRVDDVQDVPFNVAHARNIGVCAVRSKVLLFVDADVRLPAQAMEPLVSPILRGECAALAKRRWPGLAAYDARLFHELRGFDEAMEGWGFEDRDLFRRASAVAETKIIPLRSATKIEHDNGPRVRFYEIKNPKRSQALNRQLARTRSGSVNPQGYGRATAIEFWSPTNATNPVP